MRIIKLTKISIETSVELVIRVNVRYISKYYLHTLKPGISFTEIRIDGNWMNVKETPEEIDKLIED